MEHSVDRILTTHVGSLPRSRSLSDLLIRQERGEAIDRAKLDRECRAAVRHVVEQQVACGVDVINDGEQPRVGFQTYVGLRLKGYGGKSPRPFFRDFVDFPDYAEIWQKRGMATSKVFDAPQAVAEIEYADLSEAERECDLVLEVARAHAGRYRELFMTAASPGIVATTLLNAHYDSHETYVNAVAREMRKEYERIHSKGLVLQLDCPDLAMERVGLFQKEPLSRFLEVVEVHVEAINRALENVPRERVRLHVCWGNWDGPHVYDVPLAEILPILYRARVGALSLELANPRHEHEVAVLKTHPLPDSMIFVPGVIDSKTNFVEHPELVRNRILRAVEAVGDRSRVIASSDCGFGTFAGWEMVAPSVVWAKLGALREGAELASKRLWG
jgi:5-methyltetrahydropteroyltriglutamate--homocysteine methyltransferase